MGANKQPVGKGVIESGRRKIACSFDDETFAAIQQFAKREGKSFSSANAYLVKAGLLCVNESDALEVVNGNG